MNDDKEPLTSRLTLTTRGGEEGRIDNLPAPVMQALYYELTGRRERLRKDFNASYLIHNEDVSNLFHKLEQTLAQFNHQATSSSVTIFHVKEEKLTFSSLEKFLEYDTSRGELIKELTAQVDFLIAVPQVNRHQGYKLTVEMRSFVVSDDDRYSNRLLFPSRRYYGGDGRFCIRVSIEYIDYVVARSFLSTVTEWAASLERSKTSARPEWLDEVYWHLDEIAAILFGGSVAFLLASLFATFQPGLALAVVLSVCFAAAMLFGIIAKMVMAIMVERFLAAGYAPFLLLNKGGQRNYGEYLKRRTHANKLSGYIWAGLVLGIAANVISGVVLSWFWV